MSFLYDVTLDMHYKTYRYSKLYVHMEMNIGHKSG